MKGRSITSHDKMLAKLHRDLFAPITYPETYSGFSIGLAGGASPQPAQVMARHADPRTTLAYYHNPNQVQDGAERYIRI